MNLWMWIITTIGRAIKGIEVEQESDIARPDPNLVVAFVIEKKIGKYVYLYEVES